MDLFNHPDILPGIALDQPYAGLVRLGVKTLETRMRRVHKRGQVVICATRVWRADIVAEQRAKLVPGRIPSEQFIAAHTLLGCVVATANMVDCRLLEKSDEPSACFWSDADAGKRYAWVLQDIRPTVPRPVRCMPGWFPVSRELVEVQP